MTKRKFTPPTEFPAEYVDGHGHKITLLARGKGYGPLIGQDEGENWRYYTEDGSFLGEDSPYDLHDIPKKQVHWANDYDARSGWNWGWEESREDADKHADLERIAVIRREWVEGELPQYFVEEV